MVNSFRQKRKTRKNCFASARLILARCLWLTQSVVYHTVSISGNGFPSLRSGNDNNPVILAIPSSSQSGDPEQ